MYRTGWVIRDRKVNSSGSVLSQASRKLRLAILSGAALKEPLGILAHLCSLVFIYSATVCSSSFIVGTVCCCTSCSEHGLHVVLASLFSSAVESAYTRSQLLW